jgi:hypothetical protein
MSKLTRQLLQLSGSLSGSTNNLCNNLVSRETISTYNRLIPCRQQWLQAKLNQPKRIHLSDEGNCKRDCKSAGQLPAPMDADAASVLKYTGELAS